MPAGKPNFLSRHNLEDCNKFGTATALMEIEIRVDRELLEGLGRCVEFAEAQPVEPDWI